jgi:hypothetical protein
MYYSFEFTWNGKKSKREIILSVYLSKHYLLFMWHFWQRSRHMNTNQFFGEREVSGQIMAICAAAFTHVSARVCYEVPTMHHSKQQPRLCAWRKCGRKRHTSSPPECVRRWHCCFQLCFATLQLFAPMQITDYAAYLHFKHWGCTCFCWRYCREGAKRARKSEASYDGMIWSRRGAWKCKCLRFARAQRGWVNNVSVFAGSSKFLLSMHATQRGPGIKIQF